MLSQCENKEKKEKEARRIQEIEIKKRKFYYAKAHDNHWRFYQPNLEGSEGWIKGSCDQAVKNSGKIKVKVLYQYIKHYSWRYYKGSLRGISFKTNDTIDFNYKCYLPDFNIGDWLIN